MRLIWWAVIGLLGILIILLLIFSGGTPQKRIDLTTPEYSNATLTYTIDGPVTAKENHYAVRISVSAAGRSLEIIKGYENQPISTKHFDNTQAAYDALIQALQPAGFTSQNGNSTKTSIYSVCPLGNRYIYTIQNNNAEVYRAWSTSCGSGGAVTFSGKASLVRTLFQDQIPGYADLTQDVQLGGTGGSSGLLL